MKVRVIVGLLGLVVMVVGIFAPLDPGSTWIKEENTTGAPSAAATGPELIDAHRAAGQAASQVSLLTAATGRLIDGSEQLMDGTTQLSYALDQADKGAGELSAGMVQLQAGVGQMGDGATELANSIDAAVSAVVGVQAIRGQVVAAIDNSIEELRGVSTQEAVSARQTLEDLKAQVEVAELPADAVQQLNALKDGSRELSNQLDVPGYAFHDGVYAATNGSKELANALTQIKGGADQLEAGVTELKEGMGTFETMVGNTKNEVNNVQRALPAAVAHTENTSPVLPPVIAAVIALLTLLAGAGIGMANRGPWLSAAACLLSAGVGTLLVALLGSYLSAVNIVLAAAGLLAGVVASASLARVNGWLVAVVWLVQVGVVAWVWRESTYGAVEQAWQYAVGFFPGHWVSVVLSSAGNVGLNPSMWWALGLLGALVVVGLVGVTLKELKRP